MLFRRTDKYGYSRYYGNGGPALVVRIVLTLALVLALVLGGATLALQRFMVYTENGGHLELPWKQQAPASDPLDAVPLADESAAGSADSSAAEEEKGGFHLPFFGGNKAEDKEEENLSDNLVVEEGADGSAGASAPAEDSSKPNPDARKLEGDLLVQHVSIGDVTGGHAAGTLRDKGANGIMLFMKESGGSLNYSDTPAMARELGVSAAADKGSKIRSEIRSLKEDGSYTLAYLNGFDDKKLGAKDGFGLKRKGGGTWSDSNDVVWADPANEDAQKYLTEVVADMADMGFDEVVLYSAAFPFGKGADNVDSDADREAVVTAFYEALAKVSKDKDITVSVVADPDAILGKDSASGQTLENLKLLGGRVWVKSADADDPEALAKALKEAGFQDNALGLVSDKLDKDSAYPWLNED